MAIDPNLLWNGNLASYSNTAPPIFRLSDIQSSGPSRSLSSGDAESSQQIAAALNLANSGGTRSDTYGLNAMGDANNWSPQNGFQFTIKSGRDQGNQFDYQLDPTGQYYMPTSGRTRSMPHGQAYGTDVWSPLLMLAGGYFGGSALAGLGEGAAGAGAAAGEAGAAGAGELGAAGSGYIGVGSSAGSGAGAGFSAGDAAALGGAGAGTGGGASAGGNGGLFGSGIKAGDAVQLGSLAAGMLGGGSGQQGGGGGISYSGAPMRSLADIMGPQQGMQGGQRPQFSMPAITDPRGLNSAQVWQQYGQGLFGQPQMSQPQPSQPPQSQPGMLGALSPAQFAPSGNGSKVPNVPMASQPGTADMEQSYGYGQSGIGKGLLTQMPPVRRSMPTGY